MAQNLIPVSGTYATDEQIATIHKQAYDDEARAMQQSGVSLTWEQADDVGEMGTDWLVTRLGLIVTTDDAGVHARPSRVAVAK